MAASAEPTQDLPAPGTDWSPVRIVARTTLGPAAADPVRVAAARAAESQLLQDRASASREAAGRRLVWALLVGGLLTVVGVCVLLLLGGGSGSGV